MKKTMTGKHAEDVSRSEVKEIKSCMLEAMDRFHSEAEKRFSEVAILGTVVSFLNPYALLQHRADMNKFKKIYSKYVNFTELNIEIFRFNWLVYFSSFTNPSEVRASAFVSIDSGSIPSQVKSKTLKLVSVASLLDAQHLKG